MESLICIPVIEGTTSIRSPQKEMNMVNLPFPWCIYEENQSKAARCGRITDRSWGIENGLTHFLTAVQTSGVPTNQEEFRRSVNRAIATGSWIERNHARLRRKYLRHDPEPDRAPRMLASTRLAEIRSSVSAEEWGLLIAVAAGRTCREMATDSGVTAGSVRTRISRLRARLRRVACLISQPVVS